MFGSREEFTKPLKTNLVISIFGSESDQNVMKSFFKESIDQIYSNRLTINTISSVEELKIETSKLKNRISFGLINMNWITKTTSTRPSVFIIIKQLQSEASSRDIERQWIKEIQSIHQILPATIIYFIILTGTFPMVADTGDSDSIFRLKEIKAIWNYTSLEAIKKSSEVGKIQMNVINSSKDYYMVLKQKYKKKATDLAIKTELKVKSYLKIGVISLIKSRKVKAKYFEEAYKLLYNYNDITKYYYGENELLSFSEIRAAADWLFFQIHKINKIRKESSKDAFIIKANQHLSKFSHNMFIKPNKAEDALFNFFDQHWGYLFNEFIGEETSLITRSTTFLHNFSGYYYLKALYCLIRMILHLPQFENITLSTVIIDNKKYPIEALKKVPSKYYEKPDTYSDFKDFLTPMHYGFVMDLYLRYFILDNNINYTYLKGIIRQSLLPKIIKTFESITSNHLVDISFYLNTLTLASALPDEMKNDITGVYDKLLFSKHIWKYPLVYYNYLDKINDIWMNMPQLALQDKERLLKNIILVGNNRDLTQKEEQYLFKLMNDKEVKESSNLIRNSIRLKVNDDDDSVNRLLHFDYTIVNGNTTRNILDSVEFEFTISTCIESIPIKFTSVTVFFAYDKRFKKFTSFNNELTKSTPISLSHRILLKSNEKALIIKYVTFEIEGFPFMFEYKLYSKKERVVLVKQKKKNLLEFKVPKNVKIGVNELYNIHCEIIKDWSVNVDIGQMSIDFERSHTISDLIIKPNPSLVTSAIHTPSTISSLLTSSASITQTQKTPQSHSMRSTFEQMINSSQNAMQTSTIPALTQSLMMPTLEPRLEIRPEFYVKDSEGSLISKADKVSFQIENYEASNKTVSFLVKFSEIGRYTIGFNARYKIMKQEVTDDQIESKEYGKIAFEVIHPFDIRYELDSSRYMSLNKQKNFNVNSKVKVNLIISNQLDKDGIIDRISIDKQNEDITISTPLEDILNLPQEISEPIVTMMKSCWYIIPFEVYVAKEYNGKIGSISINWSTKSLRRYSRNLFNCNKFELPDINILDFCFDFAYVIPKEVSINSELNLIIQFYNKENQFKRIIFLIDNSEHFALNGILKKKLMLFPKETKEMSIRLIPLTQGKIKLPPCKIMEYPIQKYESKMNSVYYFPDFIIVKP